MMYTPQVTFCWGWSTELAVAVSVFLSTPRVLIENTRYCSVSLSSVKIFAIMTHSDPNSKPTTGDPGRGALFYWIHSQAPRQPRSSPGFRFHQGSRRTARCEEAVPWCGTTLNIYSRCLVHKIPGACMCVLVVVVMETVLHDDGGISYGVVYGRMRAIFGALPIYNELHVPNGF